MRFIFSGVDECEDAFIKATLKELSSELIVLDSTDRIHKIKGRKPCDARAHIPLANGSESQTKSSLFSS